MVGAKPSSKVRVQNTSGCALGVISTLTSLLGCPNQHLAFHICSLSPEGCPGVWLEHHIWVYTPERRFDPHGSVQDGAAQSHILSREEQMFISMHCLGILPAFLPSSVLLSQVPRIPQGVSTRGQVNHTSTCLWQDKSSFSHKLHEAE